MANPNGLKYTIIVLLGLIFLFGHMNAQNYSNDDIQCLHRIINDNSQNTLNWTGDYASWKGVMWDSSSPKRIMGLDVSNASLTKLDLTGLTELDWLFCGKNKITILTGLSELRKLSTLDCSFNDIPGIQELGELTNLKVLYCNDNKLSLLINLDKLVNLTDLDCSHNEITSLPDLNQLQKLVTLDCSSNKLTQLPSDIIQLKNLKNLKCASNQISSMPVLDHFPELLWLDCGDNIIASLNTGQSKKLQVLWCYSNQLMNLQGLDKLKNLVWLNCGDNKLLALPGLEKLEKLETLWCYSNNLEELPGLDRLIELKWLYCGDNHFQTNEFNKLNKLSQLQCTANHFYLGELYSISKALDERLLGDQYDVFQAEPMTINEELNFSSQISFGGQPTIFKLIKDNCDAVEGSDYLISDGIINFLSPGTYIVEMSNPTITDDVGIVKVFTSPIVVQSTSTIDFRIKSPAVLIYPNPVSRELFIKSETEVLNVTAFNMEGKAIYKGSSGRIPVISWDNGNYIIYIKTESGISVNKIIKE